MAKRPSEADPSQHADPQSMPPPPPDADTISPLSLILKTMRDRYAAHDHAGAIALARIAAPYLHSRLPAATSPADLSAMTDAELDAVRSQD